MSALSPAQQLAASKQRKRPKRNPPPSCKVLWTCKLTELREELNLSMRDVAEAVGLSISAYFRIEHGFADPSLSNAMSISQFFGKTPYQIWVQWRGK